MNQLVEFNGQELLVLEVNGRKAFTAETVGKALGYSDPKKAMSNLHGRYKDELLEGIHWDWYDVACHRIGDTHPQIEGGPTSTRIYYQTGANLIGMFARTKLAKDFRRWAAEVLAAVQQPEEAEGEVLGYIGRTLNFEPRCSICRHPYAEEIDRMLEEGHRLEDIVAWAAERGETVSKSSLSRHNSKHRVPMAAPKALFADPELGLSAMLAKLLVLAQRRSLDGLSDRDIVKYSHATGVALLAHRRSRSLPPPTTNP